MGVAKLTESERRVVLQCMVAIERGPFISDPAFHPMMGISRDELRQVIEEWPEIDDGAGDSVAFLGVNNSMVHLIYNDRVTPPVWAEWIGVSRAEAERIFKKWKGGSGAGEPGPQ